MEKANTASSTSHSSEIRWQGSMHTPVNQAPRSELGRSVPQQLSGRLSLTLFAVAAGTVATATVTALVLSSRWNTGLACVLVLVLVMVLLRVLLCAALRC